MSDPERASAVRQLWPLLCVRDIVRSVRFYCDRLGFRLVHDDGRPGKEMGWCRLERGGASLMLQQSAEDEGVVRGHGVCLYFVCDDADAIRAEFSARGLQLEPPRIAYYGMKQLFVPDPDGYAVCFESPTEQWARLMRVGSTAAT